MLHRKMRLLWNLRKSLMNKIAIIGGTGVTNIEGLETTLVHKNKITPYGKVQTIRQNVFGDTMVFTLSRHGAHHSIPPHQINHKANIYALKKLGVNIILSISAVGSLQDHIKPGHIVLVDDYIDMTRRQARHTTFFNQGCVAHVSMADPSCAELAKTIRFVTASSISNMNGVRMHNKGTYINIEGPQFSTRAESKVYREMYQAQVIGMTNVHEAKLAREAEICYKTLAMVTDYDCWHPNHDTVTVEQIMITMERNNTVMRSLLPPILSALSEGHRCDICTNALEGAIITKTASYGTKPTLINKL